MKRILIGIVLAGVLAFASGDSRLAAADAQEEEQAEHVAIHAKRFEFAPATVTLAKDRAAILDLTSEDVRHGFFSRDFDLDAELVPGKTTPVRITPKKSGTYTIICDYFCGSGHGNMKLTVVVP
jgi:cytochrome c oxidase subunit 2